MKEFLAALNRHHVSRVAAAYLLAAWFVIQLTNNLAPLLSLPLWLQRAILLIIVIGFPVTALFAWALQPASVGVEGKKLTTQADLALAVGLFAITGLIIYEQFAPMVGKLTLPNE